MALDLEAVRQALDIPRFSYWAASYGTVEQQAYATRFPERVRAVVADSPIPVRGNPQPWMYAYGSGPVADHAAAVHCRRAPACAHEQPRPSGRSTTWPRGCASGRSWGTPMT